MTAVTSREAAPGNAASPTESRDRDGVHKTYSGLMKILCPHGEATSKEIEEILRLSIEGRKRVKDQIHRLDSTMAPVRFEYTDTAEATYPVTTLEEDEHPGNYHRGAGAPCPTTDLGDTIPGLSRTSAASLSRAGTHAAYLSSVIAGRACRSCPATFRTSTPADSSYVAAKCRR